MGEKNQRENRPVPTQGRRSLTTSHQAGMINRPHQGKTNPNSSEAQEKKPNHQTGVDGKQHGKS